MKPMLRCTATWRFPMRWHDELSRTVGWPWGHSQQGSIAVRLGKVPQRIFLKYKETGTSAGIPVALTGLPVPIHLGDQEGAQISRTCRRAAGTAAGRDRE